MGDVNSVKVNILVSFFSRARTERTTREEK